MSDRPWHLLRGRVWKEMVAMLRLICVFALAGLLAVAPASSQTELVPDRQLLVGRCHFEEDGIAVDLSLNADSTAVYSVGGSVGIRAESTWDVRGDRIHIFNKPGPVKLALAGRPRVTQASPCESLRSYRTVRPLKA